MGEELQPERIVRLEPDRVVVLDQRRLPDEEVELDCRSSEEVADAIRTLAVRGAPAIGIAAAYGYALAVANGEDPDRAAAVLASSRPTAVNLTWALQEVRSSDDPAERAREIHRDEVERCRRMALHAAELIDPASRALTHCNTGGLATGGYGTALGAVRAAHEQGRIEHVWVDETRPLLQGARLTAWELGELGIPYAVIVDGAAGGLMAAGLGRLRARRRRPDRGERRHRQQGRHVPAGGARSAPRPSLLRRRADVHDRPGHVLRERHRDRGACAAPR